MDLYAQFAAYPFGEDAAFQEGLSRILEQNAGVDPEARETLEGRAKAFYFSSVTGQQVTWEGLQSMAELRQNTQRDNTEDASKVEGLKSEEQQDASDQNKVLSLAEIQALIEAGQEHLIPNNETIPSGVNDVSPSASQKAPPKKPWEVN